MVFNSVDFILFFTAFICLYAMVRPAWQKYLTLFASYGFYGYYEPYYILLLFGSSFVDFHIALRIFNARSKRFKKILLVISLFVNLGALFIFKYFNFFTDNVGWLIGKDLLTLELLLPIGISFYTFQTISYSVDVYRNKIEPERDLTNFLLFVSFFPQLVAGPIERASNLLSQINNGPQISWKTMRIGLFLVAYGFFVKLVIANNLTTPLLELVSQPEGRGPLVIILVGILFLFKLYADFLGYTEIARGVALIIGFRLSINFRRPLFARSTPEFWQRWHISLTSWIGDYVNKPLKNLLKGSWLRPFIVIFIMVLVGLWHGAGWNFFFYGLIQGIVIFLWRPTSSFFLKIWQPHPLISGLLGASMMHISIWVCIPLFFISDFSTYARFMNELLVFDFSTALSGLRALPHKTLLFASFIGILLMLAKDIWEELRPEAAFEILVEDNRLTFLSLISLLLVAISLLGKFTEEVFIYYAF